MNQCSESPVGRMLLVSACHDDILYYECVWLIMYVACSCNAAGSLDNGDCAREPADGGILPGDCRCKANTQGRLCDMCRRGYFNLSADNELGCQRKLSICLCVCYVCILEDVASTIQ